MISIEIFNLNFNEHVKDSTSIEQTGAHHFEGPPAMNKLGATPHGPQRIAGPESAGNDVEWESEPENNAAESAEQASADSVEKPAASNASPFDRNSNLRKPYRHKSLEQLTGSASGKGDRSTWPEIARAGKWNSLEHVRRKHESFDGQRSKSLPTSRWQSVGQLDSGSSDGSTGGLWQLTEKLNSLRSSRSTLDDSTDELRTDEQNPTARSVENPITEVQSEDPSSRSNTPASSSSASSQSGNGSQGDSSLPSNHGVEALGENTADTPLENILNRAKVFINDLRAKRH